MNNKESKSNNLVINLLTVILILSTISHIGDITGFIHDTLFGKSDDEQIETETSEYDAEDEYETNEPVYESYIPYKDYDYAHGYYYDYLIGAERLVYDELIESCETLTTSTSVTPVSETQFTNVSTALRYDHPEFYWLHYGISYSLDDRGAVICAYNPVPADAAERLDDLYWLADNLYAQTWGLSEYETYKFFYDYIIDKTSYGTADGIDDQSITGALDDHLAVCAGYSDAFKFLCDRAGLYCVTVVGTCYDYNGFNSGLHAWNLIKIDGGYTWVDVTWGDSCAETPSYIYDNPTRYLYLCVPDDILFKRHTISDTLGYNNPGHFQAGYPQCYDERFCFYDMVGISFVSYEEAQDYILSALSVGSPYVWMQFSTVEELNRAYELLNNQQAIWNLVEQSGRSYSFYYHYIDYEFNTLVFEFQ